jgi:hypothetical protein
MDLQTIKASFEPPQRLDNSAAIFSSPKKKDFKRRRRRVDIDKLEERKKERKLTKELAS